MHCVLVGRGRYDGMVERPPGPDGGPPAEVEIVVGRRPSPDDQDDTRQVIVFRLDGRNADGFPRYTRDREYTTRSTG